MNRRIVNLLALSAALMLASTRGTAQRPAAAPVKAEPWFEDTAERAGVRFVHHSGHRDRFLLPEIIGGGAALFDMDNDGDLDLYLVQSGSLLTPADKQPGNRLYRNRGDGTFDDVTAASGADVPGTAWASRQATSTTTATSIST
jgi:hypothetical protein